MIKKSLFKVVVAALLFCSPSLRPDVFEDFVWPAYAGAVSAGVTYICADVCQANNRTKLLASGAVGGLVYASWKYCYNHYFLVDACIEQANRSLSNDFLSEDIKQHANIQEMLTWLKRHKFGEKYSLVFGLSLYCEKLNETRKLHVLLKQCRHLVRDANRGRWERTMGLLQERCEILAANIALIKGEGKELYLKHENMLDAQPAVQASPRSSSSISAGDVLVLGTVAALIIKKFLSTRQREVPTEQRPEIDAETECPICFEKNTDIVTECCDQRFHRACFNQWRDANHTCPLCRRAV